MFFFGKDSARGVGWMRRMGRMGKTLALNELIAHLQSPIFPIDNTLMVGLATLSPEEIRTLSSQFESAPLVDVLTWAWERFGTRAAIGTSFQGAGLVMIHHAVKAGLPLPVF